jgi:NAD(P)H-flavin reductase/Pyruvate/2-oxoacid:ferredoxin oxidoreductase delta subunit
MVSPNLPPTTDRAAAEAALFLTRAEMPRLLAALRAGGRHIVGPTQGDGAILLDAIDSVADLPAGWTVDNAAGRSRLVEQGGERLFDQAPGPTSWKRWTFPPRVAQIDWIGADGERLPQPVEPASRPLAFLGVRACEIAALAIQDRVLHDGVVPDADYSARRRDNLIVAVECAVAGGTCFCSSMGTGPEVTAGYDLALAELDDGFVVRVGSAAGLAVLAEFDLPAATDDQQARAGAAVAAVRAQMGAPLPMADMPERLMAATASPRWAQIAERCLACANCTLVCPTCFCTSVGQRSELDGQSASTERRWDSCFTLDFARVAGGNFRTRVEDRYRQWLTHKFGTWWTQFGSSGCVGCGRCVTWCPVAIDVRAELLAVTAAPGTPPEPAQPPVAADAPFAILPPPPAVGNAPGQTGATGAPTAAHAPANGHTTSNGHADPAWVSATVVETHHETADVVTLRLRTDDPALLAGRPGQFVMASLPALAGPPISISRFRNDGLELTIRAAGPATAAMTRLERGARLGLRGPLGRSWPVEMADGHDVMIVTGGIGLAPLRPLIDALLARRDQIGAIHLAYGARTPADRLYKAELDRLAAGDEIDVALTVDRAGPEWLGRVGVVTQVIDRALCSCDRTIAFVCGPERMMAATAEVLGERGVPSERIFVTLERQMQCGVGLCGHCQLGRFFVCRDGPVFSLAELGPAFAQEGL